MEWLQTISTMGTIAIGVVVIIYKSSKFISKIEGRFDILEKQMLQFELRMNRFEERMNRFEERMDHFEERMNRFEKKITRLAIQVTKIKTRLRNH